MINFFSPPVAVKVPVPRAAPSPLAVIPRFLCRTALASYTAGAQTVGATLFDCHARSYHTSSPSLFGASLPVAEPEVGALRCPNHQ